MQYETNKMTEVKGVFTITQIRNCVSTILRIISFGLCIESAHVCVRSHQHGKLV
jgi:hypothetical protein